MCLDVVEKRVGSELKTMTSLVFCCCCFKLDIYIFLIGYAWEVGRTDWKFTEILLHKEWNDVKV